MPYMPLELIAAGLPVSAQPVKKMNDNAGGLFVGTSGPKPPPALSTAVPGMWRTAMVFFWLCASPILGRLMF